VEIQVLARLRVRDNEFTEMLNKYLRDKYNKPRMDSWLEMTEEEIRKVLRTYGNVTGV
jgi:arsenate reductase-like glutaredoxin family protein